MTDRTPFRWHILVFLAPAVCVYTAIMILPLFATLNLSLFRTVEGVRAWVGLDNFRTLFGDPRWSASFWNALGNNAWFFVVHMLVQNPIGVALAALLSAPRLRGAAFYRTAIFIPTILSFVIVGFVWKLILSPIWGIAPGMLASVGLKALFSPWLGQEGTALTTLALISVWPFVGIPMMLIYAALLSIPDEVIEAAEIDGITGWSQFWNSKSGKASSDLSLLSSRGSFRFSMPWSVADLPEASVRTRSTRLMDFQSETSSQAVMEPWVFQRLKSSLLASRTSDSESYPEKSSLKYGLYFPASRS